ncbi:MAG: DUF1499 domain-containing protein [Actinomycetota bacterium]
MLIAIALVVVAAVGALVGFVRNAAHDPGRWHKDPLTEPKPSRPNSFRIGPEHGAHGATVEPDEVAPTFPVAVDDLAAAFDSVATGEPSVEVVAGSATDGHVTYVQRSKTMGYPDYVSVRFIDLGDGTSTVSAFSRARFGYSDMGVNHQRLDRWMSGVGDRLG